MSHYWNRGSKHEAPPVGGKFGRWTVTAYSHKSTDAKGGAIHHWRCVCDCGTVRVVRAGGLIYGTSKSCGCLQKQNASASNAKHYLSRSREYRIWTGMKSRCYSKSRNCYANYGARGIKVCERWLNSFENFLADMGPRPSPKHSIDRIDNDGDYSPSNCRWATPKQQLRNTRTNRILVFRGKSLSVAQWAEDTGLSTNTLHERLLRGWSVEKTLTHPYRQRKLSNSDIQAIREKFADSGGRLGILSDLSKRYGVSVTHVSDLCAAERAAIRTTQDRVR
jgi:hypothetical protein